MANTLYPQLQYFTLYSSGVSIADTSIVLTSFQTIDGVNLAMSDFGDKGFITIDPGSGTSEEQISFSGVTQNANGTATLTGIKHVGDLSPYTEASGTTKQHSGGATCSVAITSGLLNQFANKGNAETITGAYTFTSTAIAAYNAHPTFISDFQIIDKKYADDLAIAGAPDANETTKGIIEIATAAESLAGTTNGSTGARLVNPTDLNVSTSAGAGDSGKVPVLGATGILDQTFLDSARTWGAVQSLTADNCQITSAPNSANDAVRYAQAQLMTSTNEATDTSGEAFSAGDALYLKASDEKIYKTDSDGDETAFNFIGIALEAATGADETIRYAKPGGIVTGLSGLTAGATYYLSSTAGGYSTSPAYPRYAKIGYAISTTAMMVLQPSYKKSIIQAVNWGSTAADVTNVAVGFFIAKMTVLSSIPTRGEYNFADDETCIWDDNGTLSFDNGFIFKKYVSAGVYTHYAITNVDQDGFDLDFTNTGSPGSSGSTNLTITVESD